MANDDDNPGRGPEMDEFMASVEAMNAGMADMMACALRMQMLMLEDAQMMMNQATGLFAAASARENGENDES